MPVRPKIIPVCSFISRRCFSSSPNRQSHIGSNPITIPPSVSFIFPPLSREPSPDSQLVERILEINGPLGSQLLNIHESIVLQPPSASDSDLVVSVRDPTMRKQKSVWGTTRSHINNAVVGVSEGYKVDLRLVGVGYRAAVEPIPPVFRELQKRFTKPPRPRKIGSPPATIVPDPIDRLNIKLGYSHPVLIDIPGDIKVTIPSPTIISLSGIDKQKLGIFAATIKRHRKPEPYRGKVRLAQSSLHPISDFIVGHFHRR